jgi:hypothetical protein
MIFLAFSDIDISSFTDLVRDLYQHMNISFCFTNFSYCSSIAYLFILTFIFIISSYFSGFLREILYFISVLLISNYLKLEMSSKNYNLLSYKFCNFLTHVLKYIISYLEIFYSNVHMWLRVVCAYFCLMYSKFLFCITHYIICSVWL